MASMPRVRALMPALLWVLLQVAGAASPVTMEGVLSVLHQAPGVTGAEPVVVPPPRDRNVYFLTANSGGPSELVVELRFARTPTNVASGDQLAVVGMLVVQFGLPVLVVQSYMITRPSDNKDFVYSNGTRVITSITVLTRICGSVSVDDVAAFRRAWVPTLDAYYKQCSWNRVKFPTDKNIVVDLTDAAADLGCSGTWQLQSWRASSCGTAEVFGWKQAALQKVAARFPKLNLTYYTHQVFVLPDNSCPWAGLASVGCGTTCPVWLRGARAAWPTTYTPFHELGHTLGLQHASALSKEYGDGTCAMGCCSPVCFNAPHSWQLAWARPIRVLNASTLAPARWVAFHIPALSSGPVNHVQVRPTWAGGVQPSYFISFRMPVGHDASLPAMYQRRVFLHVFNGTQSVSAHKTKLDQVLVSGSVVRRPASLLAIKVLDLNATHAHVAVCRMKNRTGVGC